MQDNNETELETLRRENADLKRQVEELRAAVAALLAPDAPPPVNDKDRLWRESHPGEARREKYG